MNTEQWVKCIDRDKPPTGLVRVRLRAGDEFNVMADDVNWEIRNASSDIIEFKRIEKLPTEKDTANWTHWHGQEIPRGKVHVLLSNHKVLSGNAAQFNWRMSKNLDCIVSFKIISDE